MKRGQMTSNSETLTMERRTEEQLACRTSGGQIILLPPEVAAHAQSIPEDDLPAPRQVAMDLIEEASMESFPCSDPPSYTACHV